MRGRLTVQTVGCKANFADSSSIVREAVSAGFEIVSSVDDADVVVINGCTVTHRADRDCRALARRARRARPSASIVMTGCYAQAAPGPGRDVPEVDHWIGIGEKDRLGGLLRSIGGGKPGPDRLPSEYEAGLLLGHRRTFLKIQDGCDFRCAYCIVPIVRGKSRSAPENEIAEKAAAAEEAGARELVLTGIHIGLYGADSGGSRNLARLIGAVAGGTARIRIRLSSIEPNEIDDRLLDAIAGEARVCRHLHVPLQSGSDGVLRRMRRPYDSDRYARIVCRIAERIPGVQIGSDVIAGFPGESGSDFEATRNLLADLPVHYLHAFPYSPRPGTESAFWRDDVSAALKKERVSRLLALDGEKRDLYLRTQLGKELEVLAETAHPGQGEISGTSGNYLEVRFRGEEKDIGELVRVKAGSCGGGILYGTRVADNA